ncbi:MAG TPA: peptide chain release factor N(5)-glutamine methyltransferase [Candidatus Obscuribacterales bacterium]
MARLDELKAELVAGLRAAGLEEAECRREADLIVEQATGWRLAEQILKANADPGPLATSQMYRILEERRRRVPLQYILGYTDFFGLRFRVAPGVFIPRPDTETLVEVTLALCRESGADRLAEIGVGTGAVAVSILKHRPSATLVGTDVCQAAVALARENATAHGVMERITLVACDWREMLLADLDGLVCNPPYIAPGAKEWLAPEIALYEPVEALYGWGEDGLGFYRDLAGRAPLCLRPGGFVAVEVGDGQAETVARIFAESGLESTLVHADLNGLPRVVSAFCKASAS